MHATRHFEQNGTKDPSSMSTQPLLIDGYLSNTSGHFSTTKRLVTGKIQKPYFTFALSPNFAHHLQNSILSQPNLFHPWINLYSLSQMTSLIHKQLSLITKTRIRGLDAFTGRPAAGRPAPQAARLLGDRLSHPHIRFG